MHPDLAIDQARALRDAGRWEEAVVLLQQALSLHPRDPGLWQTLGTVHRAREDSAAAGSAFAEAARLAPADLKAAHGVAQASLEAGRPAAALFARLQQRAPGDGSVALGRAAALLAEGRGEAAVGELAALVADNPLWLDGQATLARLRWQMGETTSFAGAYVAAIHVHPRSAELWHALIELLLQVELFDNALAVIRQAEGVVGTTRILILQEARALSELGQVAAADAAFERLADAPETAVIEQHLRHLLRTGRAEAAAARGAAAIERPDANHLWPYVSLAWRMIGDGRWTWLDGDPALVGVFDLAEAAALLPALAGRLRALHRAKRDPLGQSVRGGTQTDGPLFANEAAEIRTIRGVIDAAVERYIDGLGALDPTHPTRRHIGKRRRFAGSWSVRLTSSGHHSTHVHSQGWISSAFYVTVPSPDVAGPAPAGWLQLGAPPPSLRLPLAPIRNVEPLPGRLVLFPSTLWHGTAPIAGGERLTIAFDVAAIG
jgi:tetratricopeptide (TPR) repeat protein